MYATFFGFYIYFLLFTKFSKKKNVKQIHKKKLWPKLFRCYLLFYMKPDTKSINIIFWYYCPSIIHLFTSYILTMIHKYCDKKRNKADCPKGNSNNNPQFQRSV